jgi:hypothetical protein
MLTLCAFSASGCLLHAQTAAAPGDTAVNVPAAPATTTTDLTPSAASAPASAPAAAPAPAPAFRGFDAGTSGFGQAQTPAWTQSDSPSFRPGGRSTQNPFQLAPSFGSLSGSAGINTGFGGNAGGFGPAGFGSARQGGAANPFGSIAGGGRLGSAGPLFPGSDGPQGSGGGPFGRSAYTPPSLNEMLHGSYNLPLNSSVSSLRFSYQDVYKSGASLSDLGRPASSAMFSTSDLGNGVFLSAGTNYGSHSMAGAPAASIGNGTAAGSKHSGPSVALKLSF